MWRSAIALLIFACVIAAHACAEVRQYSTPRGAYSQAVLHLLQSSQMYVCLAAEPPLIDELSDALVSAQKRGVNVRVIVDSSRSAQTSWNASLMTIAGIDVKQLEDPYLSGHFLVVDGVHATTLPANLTSRVGMNEGDILSISRNEKEHSCELAARFMEAWESDSCVSLEPYLSREPSPFDDSSFPPGSLPEFSGGFVEVVAPHGHPVFYSSDEQTKAWFDGGWQAWCEGIEKIDIWGYRRWLWAPPEPVPLSGNSGLAGVLMITPQWIATSEGWEAARRAEDYGVALDRTLNAVRAARGTCMFGVVGHTERLAATLGFDYVLSSNGRRCKADRKSSENMWEGAFALDLRDLTLDNLYLHRLSEWVEFECARPDGSQMVPQHTAEIQLEVIAADATYYVAVSIEPDATYLTVPQYDAGEAIADEPYE
ncbi:MAG: hypothetical protein JXA57_16005 [Armatimonadetes bacterium]|nr:hypothetical protein [Armatimonadota bacterium]